MHPWGLGVNPSRWGRVDTGSRWVDPWGWGVDARSRRVDPRRRGVDHRCRGVDPGGWGVDAWSRGVDPRRRGVDPRSWGVDPRSWWGQLGRARRPRGCRPAGRHGWQRQASWRWWGQSLRQRRPRGQTIHQGWWGSLHSRRPRREAGRGRRLLHLEVELQEKLLGFPIPVSPEFAFSLINLPARHLEGNGLVGLGGHEQVLPAPVGRLDPLLVGGHEAVARRDALGDLRVVDLEEEALLAHLRVPLLGHFVAGAPNLHKLLHFHLDLLGRRLGGGLLSLLGGSPGQVGLMLLPLGVCQVAPLVVVQGQTQLALVRAQMVLHEVRVLVDVDGLQGQLPEALPAVSVALRGGGHASAPRLAPGAMLEVHGDGLGRGTSFRKPSRTAQTRCALPRTPAARLRSLLPS